MYAFNCKNGRRSVSVEAMLLDRMQRRLCLLTCDRSSMMGELVVLFSGLGFTFASMSHQLMYLTGNSNSTAAGTRLWRIEQYNYVNGELINVLNVPSGASLCPAAICPMLPCRHKQTCPIPPHQRIFIRHVDSRGEELELQQLCFAQHGADEEALLASWQDTLFAWLERVLYVIVFKRRVIMLIFAPGCAILMAECLEI